MSTRLAIGTAAVLAGIAAASRRPRGGSRGVLDAFDELSEAEERLEDAHKWLIERGGRWEDGDIGLHGPPPLQQVILSALVDDDGDPGVWIHWIEGTPGRSGAWALLRQALEAAGVTFAAGETIWEQTFQGWMRHGFHELSEDQAEALYEDSGRDPDFSDDPNNRYFMVYL